MNCNLAGISLSLPITVSILFDGKELPFQGATGGNVVAAFELLHPPPLASPPPPPPPLPLQPPPAAPGPFVYTVPFDDDADSFDGTNAACPDSGSVVADMGAAGSIEPSRSVIVWIKTSDPWGCFAHQWISSGQCGFLFCVSNALKIYVSTTGGTSSGWGTGDGNTVVTNNVWTMAGFRYDASDGSVQLFVNGQPEVKPYDASNPVDKILIAGGGAMFPSTETGVTHCAQGNSAYVGKLSKMFVYGRALTNAEMFAAYAASGTAQVPSDFAASKWTT